jgi:putative phosphoesterase
LKRLEYSSAHGNVNTGETPVGVISDTHGLLRPEVLEALAGSELVIHAGDIGSPDILPALRRLAPVEAVRGNVDIESWAETVPAITVVEVQGHSIYVLHDLKQLDLDPRVAGFAAVISGHSHVPSRKVQWRAVLQPGKCRSETIQVACVGGTAVDQREGNKGGDRRT